LEQKKVLDALNKVAKSSKEAEQLKAETEDKQEQSEHAKQRAEQDKKERVVRPEEVRPIEYGEFCKPYNKSRTARSGS